jgi:predicted negative regulator of RcsB-dependent stress response
MPKAIKRIKEKKTVDTETEVKERLSSLRDTLRESRKTAIQIFAGVLVILVAITGFFIYSASTKKKARDYESQAYRIFNSITPTQTGTEEEHYKKALEMFQKAFDTRKSPVLLFYIAACYYELGNYDDAIKTLKGFAQKYSGEQKLIPLAYQKMAMAYLRKGEVNEALTALNTLYNLPGDIFKDLALMETARLLERQGKADEARKKYEELVKKFPASPFKDEAEAKLAGKKAG